MISLHSLIKPVYTSSCRIMPVCCVFRGSYPAPEDKDTLKYWKSKSIICPVAMPTTGVTTHGVSMALDARLELGLELCSELRLKVSGRRGLRSRKDKYY